MLCYYYWVLYVHAIVELIIFLLDHHAKKRRHNRLYFSNCYAYDVFTSRQKIPLNGQHA